LVDRVNLCGVVENENLPGLMKNYSAFVLPSQRETFGLVYVESLLSGLPVLYSRDRGIDGYFDEKSIGYACDPSSVDDIAKGIDYLLEHQQELKNKIATLQENGSLNIFHKDSILDVYRSGLNKVLATR
jgi:glycosyltransferase involved in cell wall biosynthesis